MDYSGCRPRRLSQLVALGKASDLNWFTAAEKSPVRGHAGNGERGLSSTPKTFLLNFNVS